MMEKSPSISNSCLEEDNTTNYFVGKEIKNLDMKQILLINLMKHNTTIDEFEKNKIDNIIFDEKKKIASVFKDILIWNEPTELLRR